MLHSSFITKTISLHRYSIKSSKVHYQLSPNELHALTIAKKQGLETSSGALVIQTGEFTGRSPKDRFIVKDAITKDRIWWGDVNIPFSTNDFDALYNKVTTYLSGKEIFVRDSYACSDPVYRTNIRVINEYPWSNYFAYNMFLRPTDSELKDFFKNATSVYQKAAALKGLGEYGLNYKDIYELDTKEIPNFDILCAA